MRKIINYPHLANQVFGVAQYATRQTMDAVKSVIVPRLLVDNSDITLSVDSLKTEQSKPTNSTNTAIAVIPIHGILTTRMGAVNGACSELVSYERLRSDITRAIENPAVKEVVLDINSGGGSATGCKELADFIFESRQIKPITAIVNFSAFSAAYFIASSCSKIVLGQTGGVGSIGVIWEHMEASELEGKAGVKFTTLFRGDKKNIGSPHEPLGENAQAEINKMLDWSYDLFVNSVAKYRNLDVNQVISTQAGLFFGEEAVKMGLADEVMTPQDAINAIATNNQPKFNNSNQNIKIRAQAINQTNRL